MIIPYEGGLIWALGGGAIPPTGWSASLVAWKKKSGSM